MAAASLHPRHYWDPNIPQSSMASSTAASSRSFPLGSSTDRTSLDQHSPDFSQTSYGTADADMTRERWHTFASTLGIRTTDLPRSSPSPEAAKFARKISKRRSHPDKQISELILPLLTSVSNSHPRLLLVLNTTFNRDSVPLDHPSFLLGKTRLPTPRPAITIGYNPQIFHPHYRELMSGIIADPSGQPRNLDKISQTCPGAYWPFFVVEVNAESPPLANASAATATATCNNALLTLAGVVTEPHAYPIPHDAAFLATLSKSICAFSLAISSGGKSATLFAHRTSFDVDIDTSYPVPTDAVEAVKSYNLDSPSNLDALLTRVKSILAWSETTRLLAIMDVLDAFDRRVRFRETKMAQETEAWGPMDMMKRGQEAPKLLPGQVQMSGGMGKGILGSGHHHVLAPQGGKGGTLSSHHGVGGMAGLVRRTPGTPETPKTPPAVGPGGERAKMGLKVDVGVGHAGGVVVGKDGKVKKGSLFKTVLNDAMPAWTRVEM